MAEISNVKFRKEVNSELFQRIALRNKGLQDNNDASFATIQVGEAGDIDEFVEGQNSTLPLVAVEREDDTKEYTTSLVSPQKMYVIRSDEDKRLLAVSYDKRADLIKQLNGKMIRKINDITVNSWGSNNVVLSSTGTTRATDMIGTTGTRKGLGYNDLILVRENFNKFGIGDEFGSAGQQYGLLTPAQISDLYQLDKLTDMEKVALMNVKNGSVAEAMIMGFKIMMRWNPILGNTGVSYTNAATPLKKARTAAVAASDSSAAIFWDASLVRSGLSPVKTTINRDQAAYAGGDTIYMEARFGATIKRSDEVGVVSLVEDWVS